MRSSCRFCFGTGGEKPTWFERRLLLNPWLGHFSVYVAQRQTREIPHNEASSQSAERRCAVVRFLRRQHLRQRLDGFSVAHHPQRDRSVPTILRPYWGYSSYRSSSPNASKSDSAGFSRYSASAASAAATRMRSRSSWDSFSNSRAL